MRRRERQQQDEACQGRRAGSVSDSGGRSVSCGHGRLSLLKLTGLQASQCIEAVRAGNSKEGCGEKA